MKKFVLVIFALLIFIFPLNVYAITIDNVETWCSTGFDITIKDIKNPNDCLQISADDCEGNVVIINKCDNVFYTYEDGQIDYTYMITSNKELYEEYKASVKIHNENYPESAGETLTRVSSNKYVRPTTEDWKVKIYSEEDGVDTVITGTAEIDGYTEPWWKNDNSPIFIILILGGTVLIIGVVLLFYLINKKKNKNTSQ
ncbi:MAG: hypothetical protein ACNFW9_04530 [Candidatus Kerfeldbacteria bacterium]|jgi:hypothetical protein